MISPLTLSFRKKNIGLIPVIDELLSVGDMILLWGYQEESWDLTWKKKPADEVIYAKFEPNSSSFAAICKV